MVECQRNRITIFEMRRAQLSSSRASVAALRAFPSDRVLDAAAALFWRKGYAAASTRELAAALGMEKASLYYHFKKKEDVLYAICVTCLEHGIRTVTEAVLKATTPTEKVHTLIRAHLRAILDSPDRYATTLTELRSLGPKRRKKVMELRDQHESFVRSILQNAQAEGIVRKDIPVKYLSLSLLDLLNYSMFWFQHGKNLSTENLADLFITIFFDGVTANADALSTVQPSFPGRDAVPSSGEENAPRDFPRRLNS